MDPQLLQIVCFQCLSAPTLSYHQWSRHDHCHKARAEPVASHSPVPVAHHLKREVKTLFDNGVKTGLMQVVPAGTPSTWCSRFLVTLKKNGKIRPVVDFQPLNAVSLRETHHTATPWNLVSLIPKNMKKTILDASNAYHSVKLAPESRDKTTFIILNGDVTAICVRPKGSQGAATRIQNDSMILLWM